MSEVENSINYEELELTKQQFITYIKTMAASNWLIACSEKQISTFFAQNQQENNGRVLGKDFSFFVEAIKRRNREEMNAEGDYFTQQLLFWDDEGRRSVSVDELTEIISLCPKKSLICQSLADELTNYTYISCKKLRSFIEEIMRELQTEASLTLRHSPSLAVSFLQDPIQSVEDFLERSKYVSMDHQHTFSEVEDTILSYVGGCNDSQSNILDIKSVPLVIATLKDYAYLNAQNVNMLKTNLKDPLILDRLEQFQTACEGREKIILDQLQGMFEIKAEIIQKNNRLLIQNDLQSGENTRLLTLIQELRRKSAEQFERLSFYEQELRKQQARNYELEQEVTQLQVESREQGRLLQAKSEDIDSLKEILQTNKNTAEQEDREKKIFTVRTIRQQLQEANVKISRLIEEKKVFYDQNRTLQETIQRFEAQIECQQREINQLQEKQNQAKKVNELSGLKDDRFVWSKFGDSQVAVGSRISHHRKEYIQQTEDLPCDNSIQSVQKQMGQEKDYPLRIKSQINSSIFENGVNRSNYLAPSKQEEKKEINPPPIQIAIPKKVEPLKLTDRLRQSFRNNISPRLSFMRKSIDKKKDSQANAQSDKRFMKKKQVDISYLEVHEKLPTNVNEGDFVGLNQDQQLMLVSLVSRVEAEISSKIQEKKNAEKIERLCYFTTAVSQLGQDGSRYPKNILITKKTIFILDSKYRLQYSISFRNIHRITFCHFNENVVVIHSRKIKEELDSSRKRKEELDSSRRRNEELDSSRRRSLPSQFVLLVRQRRQFLRFLQFNCMEKLMKSDVKLSIEKQNTLYLKDANGKERLLCQFGDYLNPFALVESTCSNVFNISIKQSGLFSGTTKAIMLLQPAGMFIFSGSILTSTSSFWKLLPIVEHMSIVALSDNKGTNIGLQITYRYWDETYKMTVSSVAELHRLRSALEEIKVQNDVGKRSRQHQLSNLIQFMRAK